MTKLEKEINELIMFIEDNLDKLNETDKSNFEALKNEKASLDIEKQYVLLRNKVMYGEGEEKLERLSA